jgi:hypothetical protein
MAKIILAVAMLSAVFVSNVAQADPYIPGQGYDERGGISVNEFPG